jgi:adenylate cyclase
MDIGDVDRIAAWLLDRGLAGAAETALLDGFCERCSAAGLALSRAQLIIDTLHPVYEGRAFNWRRDGASPNRVLEYGSSEDGEGAADWRASPFYHLEQSGAPELRRQIGLGDPTDFPFLVTLKAQGHTDYLAMAHRFTGDGAVGGMDCLYSSWATAHPYGFGDDDLAALRRLLPSLALAIKCTSLARIAETLVEVYLGRDAGRRVLSGRISRGVAERINAVLWFSDLRGYTAISDSAAPDEIIPLLNDYADAVISAIGQAGGEVLKLIGDGVLAIFRADDPARACHAALRAEAQLQSNVAALNIRRAATGRPVTSVYLGLHLGDVFYGNIGSVDRLDFTVVGPAVNEVGRIAAMCRSADRGVLLSAEFVAATPEPERGTLVSVGRYALRGVGRAQELFTLDPGEPAPV